MIGLIAATTKNGIIGINGELPFSYPEDMKHFRTTTTDSVVIMGRKTFESINRPLPKRRNIVVANVNYVAPDGVETVSNVARAIAKTINEDKRNIWFIGGASIYEEGMLYADKILLTITPDMETRRPAVRFPWVNPQIFELKSISPLNPNSMLNLATYEKIK